MTKTIKNKSKKNKSKKNKSKKNKSKKNKTRRNNKRESIKIILKEWKTLTGCYYERDKTTIYKGDYYLSLNKKCDYNNHIHLILNDLNDIKYVMKKIDKKDNKIVHSKQIKINIFADPKKVVDSMIKNFKEFNKL